MHQKKTFNSNHGFTLVELLIAVTISALLMTSIMIFTGTTLRNNAKSHKILQSANSNFAFEQKLLDTVKIISGSGILESGTNYGEYETGIFVATANQGLPITFIGLKTSTGYCDSYGDIANETGTVNKLTLKDLSSENTHTITTGSYKINHAKNSIYNSTGARIIGTGNEGNSINENNPLLTELHNPNAIIEDSGYLYIADTGNNRILSYNIASNKVKVLLDESDGIKSPQDIYMTGGKLYIANTGKGEILSMSDGDGSNGSTLDITLKSTKSISVDSIRFKFDGISTVSSPGLRSDFTFTGITASAGDTVSTGAVLTYTFTGALKTLSGGTDYGIRVSNIGPIPAATGSYSVNVMFMSGGQLLYSDNLPYHIKGDGTIYSSTGNVLKKVASGLEYPHDMTGTSLWNTNIPDWSSLLNNGNSGLTESELPIKEFSYSINSGILTIKYSYYKYYDCINGKHIIKEKIIKKAIEN